MENLLGLAQGSELPIRPRSSFDELGFKGSIEQLKNRVCKLYLEDGVPWVVGYSGGKDSTATLQLVWLALSELPADKLNKPVHVISTDTLVENPIVAGWVTHSLALMSDAATEQGLPIQAHKLTPQIRDSFWVNLIGKGYPAPRPKFRWCTERLKIKPSNRFILDVVKSNGEAIVVLGTRKAESGVRRARMTNLESRRERDFLSPNQQLPNALVFSPLEEWTNDDVWTFLMQVKNPWGNDNKDLLTMYQGASEDGECPLVVDSSTPSCGSSRFGCWTCTLVEQDKSMSAMIQNDEEKEWMLPLLELRNELDIANDRHLRDFRRMNGSVQLFHEKSIPGPYLQSARETWLIKLLSAQKWIRENGPEEFSKLELITDAELEEIRRIWVFEKHEIEDSLPRIFEEVTGEEYHYPSLDEHLPFGEDLYLSLKEVAKEDRLHFEFVRELLDVEQRHRSKIRRAGLFDDLEKSFKKFYFDNEQDATEWASKKKAVIDRLSENIEDEGWN